MYNPETNETFDKKPYWWEQAEPLWITTTKHNIRTDLYLWLGCDVPIKGVKPQYCIPYSQRLWVTGFKHDLTTALNKLQKDESDVALIYCEQPDLFGHIFGPNSIIVDVTIRILDFIIKKFFDDLKSRGLENKVLQYSLLLWF